MTLQEAINHCYEVAQDLQESVSEVTECQACANEHLQLAHWLEKLVKIEQIINLEKVQCGVFIKSGKPITRIYHSKEKIRDIKKVLEE